MNTQLLFFNLGGGEVFMIILIILLLFGANKIPEIARGLGKGIRQFKDATQDIQRDIESGIKETKKEIDEVKNTITKDTPKKNGGS